jgi:zinc protease
MQTTPVSGKELHQAKALLLGQIPMSESSTGDIAHQLLALSVIGLPLDESTQAARHYFEITAEQVQSAYRKWLRPDDMAQVIEGPSTSP